MTAAVKLVEGDDFEVGYRIGWARCYPIAYSHGVDDSDARWTSVLTGCTDTWRQPRLAETLAAREVTHGPCRTRCGRCSACVHAEAWRRRGGRPFLGVEAEAALRDAA